MYAMQSKYRTHRLTTDDNISTFLAETYNTLGPSPIIFTTMCLTEFMIHPSVQSAMEVLSAYRQEGMILNIFSSHWVYKAAIYVIQHGDEGSIMNGSSTASQVLERCAFKWPNARNLLGALQNLMMSKLPSMAG